MGDGWPGSRKAGVSCWSLNRMSSGFSSAERPESDLPRHAVLVSTWMLHVCLACACVNARVKSAPGLFHSLSFLSFLHFVFDQPSIALLFFSLIYFVLLIFLSVT